MGCRRCGSTWPRAWPDGVDCTADDVLILQGGQQGLDLVGKLVLDPGDTVITEDPTFLGALIAFAPNEPTYAPVRTDDDGMDMDDLERVLARSPRAKLLYTVPDFQNPTGVTLVPGATTTGSSSWPISTT